MSNYYHAGPKGLSELRTLRDLIDSGVVTIEQAQEGWLNKWNDWIEESSLLAHPTMDEISLTSDLDEATHIASLQDGQVYILEGPEILRINEEGYPVCGGPVACKPI